MFYSIFKKLKDNSIYFPKISNADIYLEFIEKNQFNDELENAYQDFTKNYDKKNIEWLYYYVYIILLNDIGDTLNSNMYKTIITSLTNLIVKSKQ